MYKYINDCVDYCLRGNVNRCSLILIAIRISALTEILFLFVSIYLLISETSFLNSINMNNFVSVVLVYIFLFVIGISLHYITLFLRYKLKENLISQFQSYKKVKFSFIFLSKFSIVRLYIIISKTITMLLFLSPSLILNFVFIYCMNSGVSRDMAALLVISSVILFLIGITTVLLIWQKYSFAEYSLCLLPDKSLLTIIKNCRFMMNNKYKSLLKFKIRSIPFSILGLFFPKLNVIKSAREYFFITDKTIEYARKSHTHKSVIFYCKDIIA